jgi:ribonuclease HII
MPDLSNRRVRSQPPGLRWERAAWTDGKAIVAGVDEVGRGAWAGPLVAAAVVLPQDRVQRARITRALNRAETLAHDSKVLTAEQRLRTVSVLQDQQVPYAVAEIPPEEIDRIGLSEANRQALCAAVEALDPTPDHVLVDAFRLPQLRCTHAAIVRGDSLCVSIALASIVAKLHRDTIMLELDTRYPNYGFASHKGYGTATHANALRRHGVTELHRRSFAPIAAMVNHAEAR